ncbi:MAG: hypothetical protein JZU45_04270 [Methyloversatilis discipulorum]|uniref:hypothetical protein n=1 Tax=Methyloversatilis discipulorum TaxID=1119528 RepID=UPI0026EF53A5|nr:hypothetical protein [Methyloversatilis discipulorum]MBV5285276.1 hypothetical protein [Methyloversatilis discipulorum]
MTPTHPTRLGALAGSMTRSVRGAAMTFSQIVSERVGMSVSHVALADRESLQRSLCALDEFSGGRLCVVAQRMRTADGQAAEALLALPEEGALLIVRRMLGLADVSDELTELEQDALAEAGSIVIDACSGGLAGAFGWKVEATQPRVALSSRDCGFGVDESLQNALVTHLHIHLSGLRVEGRVVLEMVADTALPAASRYSLSA